MIIFDTETTGLPLRGNAPLNKQPHIIEFAAIKLDNETMEEVDRMEFICKPPIEFLEPIITKITGITMEQIADSPRFLSDKLPFKAYFKQLVKFFHGEWHMVAHNVSFDRNLMEFEMKRLECMSKFPWPPIHVCTVEKTYSIKNHRLKMGQMYEWLFNEQFVDAHQAMPDCEALTKCVIELKKREIL